MFGLWLGFLGLPTTTAWWEYRVLGNRKIMAGTFGRFSGKLDILVSLLSLVRGCFFFYESKFGDLNRLFYKGKLWLADFSEN